LPDALTATRWDEEYRRGRYAAEPPVAFVDTIVKALDARPALRGRPGLYVGCGNGRNFLPLVDAGLALTGLDLSAEALRQLEARRPDARLHLEHGDFLTYAPTAAPAYVVAIQVFQHGRRAAAEAYFARVADLLGPGGLLFLRVNAASTEVYHRHTVVERAADGFTVEYEDGPKQGLAVHFYGRHELDDLTALAFRPVHEPREDVVRRPPPKHGSWSQWEAVYERVVSGDADPSARRA
jgi:SAM-dependent methyltransferase